MELRPIWVCFATLVVRPARTARDSGNFDGPEVFL